MATPSRATRHKADSGKTCISSWAAYPRRHSPPCNSTAGSTPPSPAPAPASSSSTPPSPPSNRYRCCESNYLPYININAVINNAMITTLIGIIHINRYFHGFFILSIALNCLRHSFLVCFIAFFSEAVNSLI